MTMLEEVILRTIVVLDMLVAEDHSPNQSVAAGWVKVGEKNYPVYWRGHLTEQPKLGPDSDETMDFFISVMKTTDERCFVILAYHLTGPTAIRDAVELHQLLSQQEYDRWDAERLLNEAVAAEERGDRDRAKILFEQAVQLTA